MGKLQGHGFGQHNDPALAGVIMGIAKFPGQSIFACHIYYGPFFPFRHVLAHRLGSEKTARQIYINDSPPLLFFNFEKRSFIGNSGIIDKNIDGCNFFCGIHCFSNFCSTRHINMKRMHVKAFSFQFLGGVV